MRGAGEIGDELKEVNEEQAALHHADGDLGTCFRHREGSTTGRVRGEHPRTEHDDGRQKNHCLYISARCERLGRPASTEQPTSHHGGTAQVVMCVGEGRDRGQRTAETRRDTCRPLAGLPGWGPKGRWFKSSRPDQSETAVIAADSALSAGDPQASAGSIWGPISRFKRSPRLLLHEAVA